MIATEEKQITDVQVENFNLVSGDFTPNEALEIVTDLFGKKINFNEVKSFSQLIQRGSKDPQTLHRISELKLAQDQAIELLNEAKANGKSVSMSSTITIEIH